MESFGGISMCMGHGSHTAGNTYGGGHEENTLETLRKRFARGELTKEQYEEMRSLLSADENAGHH
jgi:uncharacterized membrane protein